MEKFYSINERWSAEDRRRLLAFARDLLNSDYAGHRLTFELFARPVLRTMLGDPKPTRPNVEAVLDETIEHGAGRRSFVRGIVYRDGNGYRVKQSGGQDSGMLHAMAAANSLIVIPEDLDRVEAGKTTSVIVIDPASL